jgi:hypothetical protein
MEIQRFCAAQACPESLGHTGATDYRISMQFALPMLACVLLANCRHCDFLSMGWYFPGASMLENVRCRSRSHHRENQG